MTKEALAHFWQQILVKIDESSGSGGVQSNWAQNDTSAADYVQNRTHYYEEGTFEQVLYEKTLVAEGFGGPTGDVYRDEFQTSIPFSESDLPVTLYIGNQSWQITRLADGLYQPDNDYTIYIGINQAGGEGNNWSGFFVEIWGGGYGDQVIKFTKTVNGRYNQLDENYIPLNARQGSWGESNPAASGYIKNRTHYDTYNDLTILYQGEMSGSGYGGPSGYAYYDTSVQSLNITNFSASNPLVVFFADGSWVTLDSQDSNGLYTGAAGEWEVAYLGFGSGSEGSEWGGLFVEINGEYDARGSSNYIVIAQGKYDVVALDEKFLPEKAAKNGDYIQISMTGSSTYSNTVSLPGKGSYVTWNTYGTLPITRGGTGKTSVVDTAYTTSKFRGTSLHSSDTTPTNNGTICWTYE